MPNRLRPMAATTRLRARDVDRAAVREALDSAFADGQLTDAEHRNRVEAAGSARTLADLGRLVRDLQVPAELRESVAPAPPRSTRWAVALATVVVLVCGVVVVASSLDNDDPAAGTAGAQAELTSAAGFGRMLDEIAHHLDDSQVDQLTVHPTYATFTRPVPGRPGSEQSYRYEVADGRARIADDGTSPRVTEGVPVDLAELRPNVSRLIGLLNGADRTLGVGDPTDAYLIADRGDDGPAVGIYLRNEDTGAQGFLTVGFDGTVLSVHRSDR